MPVERLFLDSFGMTYVRATSPFVPGDLVDRLARDLRDDVPVWRLSWPMIVDLRAVDLLQFRSEDFKALIRKRQSLEDRINVGPCAFVAADKGSFGMLRMYTSYAHLSGLRMEDQAFVTTDLSEAVHWIAPRLDGAVVSPAALLKALA